MWSVPIPRRSPLSCLTKSSSPESPSTPGTGSAGNASPPPSTFTDVSPIDGRALGEIARGGPGEADAAVAAASAAFPGWAATPRAERARVLHAIADGVEKRIEELAIVETNDNGALLRSHRRGVMPRVAHNFRFFADWLLKLDHEDFETRGHTNHVSWDPAGPSVLITPWNAPLMLATWKVAPALAAGNTVILKPAEWTPLTASLLADIAAEAGLPAGVLNVVQGYGSEIGDALTSHPDVRRISFTGIGADRQADRRLGGAATSPRSASNSAASHRCWCSRTPIWTWPWTSRWSSTTTPGRCAWPRPASSSRSRSPRSSPGGSWRRRRR